MATVSVAKNIGHALEAGTVQVCCSIQLVDGVLPYPIRHPQPELGCIQDARFAVNLCRSFLKMKELDYLGYNLTQRGLEPQPKKVEAIQRVLPPSTKRQLRRFLGMINYDRDIWKRRSHVLTPLTAFATKK